MTTKKGTPKSEDGVFGIEEMCAEDGMNFVLAKMWEHRNDARRTAVLRQMLHAVNATVVL